MDGKYKITYSENMPSILKTLDSSLVISCYDANIVSIISNESGQLKQSVHVCDKPMGVCVFENKVSVAARTCINNYSVLKSDTKRALVKSSSFYCGEVDTHDINYLNGELISVNTAFSCISLLGKEYSFIPIWKPSFIKTITPGDVCHLNGMAIADGKTKLVSALSDKNDSWRNTNMKQGVLIDYESTEPIVSNLYIPHSPRVYNKSVYALMSGTGEIVSIDLNNGKTTAINKIEGFLRGLEIVQNYAFVGVSRLRDGKLFGIELNEKDSFSGVVVVNLISGNVIGYVKYSEEIREIYDIKISKGLPISFDNNLITTPEGCYNVKPKA